MSTVVEPRPAAPRERFSLDPLLADLGVGLNVSEQARILGVDRRQLHRWKHTGLQAKVADDLAWRRGVHPSYFWSEWWGAA